MAKIALIKQQDNSFKLFTDTDLEESKKIKVGEIYVYEYKKPRNLKFHRKFFALIKLLFDNQEVYQDIEDLRQDLTIAAGYYTIRQDMHGNDVPKPMSISFSSMDEHQFNNLYNDIIDVIVVKFNFNRDDIRENVQRYF